MKLFLGLTLSLLAQSMLAQELMAPPQWKDLLAKPFKSEAEISLLKGFTQREGTLLSDPQDFEKKSVVIFRKDNTALILFEATSEPDNRLYVIDVIEIKNISKTQEIKSGTCRYGQNDDPYLVALVEQSKLGRWKAVKAWFFNLDKSRITTVEAKMVTCLGIEGED